MGMAASQGRLLFMTARISNNEFEQQCVAYSKQRLADASQAANDQYLDALSATQYQIITGYEGDTPTYQAVTYNQLTGFNNVASGKQYIITDNAGQIVVNNEIAKAFGSDGKDATTGKWKCAAVDFNTFLKNLGDTTLELTALTQIEGEVSETEVHEAWDRYFVSIGKADKNGMYNYAVTSSSPSYHALGFTYREGDNGLGYVSYNTASVTGLSGYQIYLHEKDDGSYYYNNIPLEFESYEKEDGTQGIRAKFALSDEIIKSTSSGDVHYNMMQDSGYSYLLPDAFHIESQINESTGKMEYSINGSAYAEEYYVNPAADFINVGGLTIADISNQRTSASIVGSISIGDNPIFYEGCTAEQRELYDYAMAVTEKHAKGSQLVYDSDKVQYYRNIYNQMITKGFTTYEKMIDEKYINTAVNYANEYTMSPTGNSGVGPLNDDNWLVNLVKNKKLCISYYDVPNKQFVQTTLDDDESIVNKEDKKKMAIAEQVYQNHMDQIQREDKQFDMQLSKLESEHTALTTEYDSVARVISKNVEKSFGTFNA